MATKAKPSKEAKALMVENFRRACIGIINDCIESGNPADGAFCKEVRECAGLSLEEVAKSGRFSVCEIMRFELGLPARPDHKVKNRIPAPDLWECRN